MATTSTTSRVSPDTGQQSPQRTSSGSSTKTAPKTTSAAPAQQKKINLEAREELEIRTQATNPEGIITGTVRSVAEDQLKSASLNTIKSTQQTLNAVRTAATTQTTTASEARQQSVSSKQLVVNYESIIFESSKNKNDTLRALQRTQRRCNHKYSLVTRRCIYCDKHRDSHIYDAKEKSILRDL